jgi:hypothetical protein
LAVLRVRRGGGPCLGWAVRPVWCVFYSFEEGSDLVGVVFVHSLDLDFLFVVDLFPMLEEGVERDYRNALSEGESEDEVVHCWPLGLHR